MRVDAVQPGGHRFVALDTQYRGLASVDVELRTFISCYQLWRHCHRFYPLVRALLEDTASTKPWASIVGEARRLRSTRGLKRSESQAPNAHRWIKGRSSRLAALQRLA